MYNLCFFSNGMQRMGKQQLVNQFTKSIISEEQRKNKVSTSQVTSTLINAGLNMAFVNESCKSTSQVSKSQVIYRKLKGKSLGEIQECFQENTVQFLKILLVFLPPYSPDLNPIEFIWKSIKKELSSKFLMTKDEIRDAVEPLFYKFSLSLSFAKSWIQKFLKPLHIKL